MSSKRIFWTLMIIGTMIASMTAAQAQSTGRKLWPRSGAVTNPVPAAPDQTAESAPIAELKFAPQGAAKKTAIVGSWLGTTGSGHRLVGSFTGEGIFLSSVESEVSTIPELGVLTPTHGVWEYISGQQFTVTTVGLIYDINTGEDLGTLKVRVLLTLDATGDRMIGTDKVEIFDPAGNLVFAEPGGPVSYTRIKAQPFN